MSTTLTLTTVTSGADPAGTAAVLWCLAVAWAAAQGYRVTAILVNWRRP